jgi:hypothetical protein
LFSNNIAQALENNPEQTRVAPTPDEDDGPDGFGVFFYITNTGQLMIQFKTPPAHDLHGYPEAMGKFLYNLTNGNLNETCYDSFFQLIGDCPFTNEIMDHWHSLIDASNTPPSGPLVKPGNTFEASDLLRRGGPTPDGQ